VISSIEKVVKFVKNHEHILRFLAWVLRVGSGDGELTNGWRSSTSSESSHQSSSIRHQPDLEGMCLSESQTWYVWFLDLYKSL